MINRIWWKGLLECRAEFTKHILVLPSDIDNCIFFATHDSIPNHNLIFNLPKKELVRQHIRLVCQIASKARVRSNKYSTETETKCRLVSVSVRLSNPDFFFRGHIKIENQKEKAYSTHPLCIRVVRLEIKEYLLSVPVEEWREVWSRWVGRHRM